MMPLMRSGVRKVALTVHVLASVGWVGAVTVFLALAIFGYVTTDPELVGGIYASLRLTVWLLIVPLSFLALATGIIQSLGTSWGLVRYYWVTAKLVLTTGATAALLLHTGAVDRAAVGATTAHAGMEMDVAGVRIQLIVDSAAALVVLVLLTVLSTVKPRGLTPWYQLRQQRGSATRA